MTDWERVRREIAGRPEVQAIVANKTCRVYWGSHGCDRERGHAGPHICDSCWDPADTEGYVGAPPYYGPDTRFYGEDAPSVVQEPLTND